MNALPYDVIVVGGGPAGAAAARAAHLAKRRVLLLERDAMPAEKICGEYLCPGAVEALHAMGFGPALNAARSAPLLGMRLFSPAGREVRTDFPAGRAGLSVRRVELDPLLVDASGATVVRGATVTRIERTAHGVHVHTRESGAHEGSVVIGADGRRGIVAREAGLRGAPRGRARATLHAYLQGVRGREPFGEMHLPGDGSCFGLNPGPDDLVNVTYVLDLDAVPADVAQRAGPLLLAAMARVPSLAARCSDARIAGEVRVLAPLQVRSSATTANRVLLAGDAAGFLDPLTGEGMHGAIVTGRLAGEHAARAIATGRADARALSRYGRECRVALGTKHGFDRLLQGILRRPRLLEFLGGRLRRSRALANQLIGVIGNVAAPITLLAPRHLAGLILPGRDA